MDCPKYITVNIMTLGPKFLTVIISYLDYFNFNHTAGGNSYLSSVSICCWKQIFKRLLGAPRNCSVH